MTGDAHFSPGSMAGPYRIAERIGAGGMGEVYRAQDTRLSRTVAIKTSKASFTDRFQHEARAISALNHPHICTLYDVGFENGVGYLVMEYVEGKVLKGPLPVAEALGLAVQIAGALEAAHERGILHRDLKPGNIMVSKSGVKLLDFGLAKFVAVAADPEALTSEAMTSEAMTRTASLTVTGQVVGTPAYMSPEQIEGKPVDARSDLFAFGLVLYETITGRRAFEAASQFGIMAAILKGDLPPLDVLPAHVECVVRKCLARDPEQRWQTAAELRHALERIAAGEPAPPKRSYTLPAIAAAAMLLLFALAGYLVLHRAPPLTDKDTIVLADFENRTGDPVFDGALRQGLAVQLEQSPFLSLISDDRIQEVLSLMTQPADARLTPEIARQICERTGSAAVLEGSIARLGSQYVLGLRARSCRGGRVLDEEQGTAAGKEEVLKELGRIAGTFRTRIGESLATVEKHQTRLEDATTSKLEALKAYSTGLQLILFNDDSNGIPFFRHAIEIDNGFAMAYAMLGRAYGDIWEPVRAAENLTEAYKLRDRASERERLFIVGNYHTQVTGNLDKARETGELWARTYPRDPHPIGMLSYVYQELGQSGKSAEAAAQTIERAPELFFGYNNLAWAYIQLNQPEKAEETLRLAGVRKTHYFEYPMIRYTIGFLRGDRPAMTREAAATVGKPNEEDWMSALEAATLGYSGRLREARARLRHAVDLDRQPAQQERAALYQAGGSVREALFGNVKEARQQASAARKLSDSRDVKYGAALAFAFSGDTAASQRIASDLAEHLPDDTLVTFVYLPTLRSLAALPRDPARSLELLRASSPYDLSAQGGSSGCFGNMYTAYVRGLAYEALHRGTEAAAEFRNILDHPGLVANDPIGAMAQLELGRAFQLAGDKTQAKLAYSKVLALWAGADPDSIVPAQARAEYARLQ